MIGWRGIWAANYSEDKTLEVTGAGLTRREKKKEEERGREGLALAVKASNL